MQLNKASKKTAKTAEKPVSAAPEKGDATEQTAKPRTSRSSKPKKSEVTETGSGTHHRKPASSPLPELALNSSVPGHDLSAQWEIKPLSDRPSSATHSNQIAELAYSYWLERGCTHGSSEEDWLRAEKKLAAAS